MCRWAAALVARRAVPRNIKSRLDPLRPCSITIWPAGLDQVD